MDMETKKRPGGQILTSRIWMILMTLVGFVILIISITILVFVSRDKEQKSIQSNEQLNDTSQPFMTDVLERFPGYFRTEEEQWNIQNIMKDMSNLNESLTPNPGLWSVYQACCASNSSYSRPTQLKDIRGNMQQIIQFPGLSQYVLQDTCETIVDCGGRQCGCQCKIINFVVTLVYFAKQGSAAIGQFNSGEVCKCMNIN